MTTAGLVLKEIAHRKLNFALGLLGVVTAVAFFVFFYTAAQGSQRETARLMRDIGLNLRIIPRQTNMNKFWTDGFSDKTMPEAYVDTLAGQRGLNYSHLVATLQRKVEWSGREALLMGIRPETAAPDRVKPAMSFAIKRGTIYLGFELAGGAGVKKGETIEIFGKPFTVATCLRESGSEDDVRIFAHLHDVQELLKLEGQINEIKALNCLCLDPTKDPLEVLRDQLGKVLPEAKVIQMRAIADAREKQRRMVENYLAIIIPVVVVVCAAWIGMLAMINVREREQEIGILRALGYRSGKIGSLFLGKAVVLGVLGAVVGFALGTWLALTYGPEVFKVTGKAMKPLYDVFAWSLIGATVFAALSTFIPTMVAVTQDPAVTLRKE